MASLKRFYFIGLTCLLFLSVGAIAQAYGPSSIVIREDTGAILHQENAWKPHRPASLVKMMTLYMAFEALSTKKTSMNQYIHVSKYAASRPRTNLNLRPGERISVRDAIMGIIVHSANDASAAIAEHLAGSEHSFVHSMNKKAKFLGMHNTFFANASGLHHISQISTAADLAKLAVALKRHYPQFYPLFSSTHFSRNGQVYRSHNRVVMNNEWVDGLKTGFINQSGFNIATSGSKHGVNLIGIVLGSHSAPSRDKKIVKLLNICFDKIRGKSSETIASTTRDMQPISISYSPSSYKNKKSYNISKKNKIYNKNLAKVSSKKKLSKT